MIIKTNRRRCRDRTRFRKAVCCRSRSARTDAMRDRSNSRRAERKDCRAIFAYCEVARRSIVAILRGRRRRVRASCPRRPRSAIHGLPALGTSEDERLSCSHCRVTSEPQFGHCRTKMDLMDIPFTARSIVMALSAAALALGPADQTPRGPMQRNELATKYLKVLVTPIDRLAAPGSQIKLGLEITPGPKIHVYAPEQQDYIPVSLKLQSSDDFKASPAKFSPSQTLFLAPINETAKVYDKPFQIEQEITLARSAALMRRAAAKDTLVVTGTLGYQACD